MIANRGGLSGSEPQLLLPASLAQEIANYLITRPCNETMPMVQKMSQLQLAPEAKTTTAPYIQRDLEDWLAQQAAGTVF